MDIWCVQFTFASCIITCHSFNDAGRRQGIQALETEDSVTPGYSRLDGTMSPSGCLAPQVRRAWQPGRDAGAMDSEYSVAPWGLLNLFSCWMKQLKLAQSQPLFATKGGAYQAPLHLWGFSRVLLECCHSPSPRISWPRDQTRLQTDSRHCLSHQGSSACRFSVLKGAFKSKPLSSLAQRETLPLLSLTKKNLFVLREDYFYLPRLFI